MHRGAISSFWCSVGFMRLQVWHFQSLSSLCDCIAASIEIQKIISVKLTNLSVCGSRKYPCPVPKEVIGNFHGGGGLPEQKLEFLEGWGMDIFWINRLSNNFQVYFTNRKYFSPPNPPVLNNITFWPIKQLITIWNFASLVIQFDLICHKILKTQWQEMKSNHYSI